MFKVEFIYRLVRSSISTIIFTAVLLFAEYITNSKSFDEILDSNNLLANLIAKAFILSHLTGFAKVFLTRKKNSSFLISEDGKFSELLIYFILWNLISYLILVLINSFSVELSFNVNTLDIAIISLLSLVNLSMNISVVTSKK